MNKTTIIVILTALSIGFCSCNEQPSKQYKAMEEEMKLVEEQISVINDCDELQMLNFALLGLRSELENLELEAVITDVEIAQLNDKVDGIEASWNGKWAALDCEASLGFDELDTSGEEDGYED